MTRAHLKGLIASLRLKLENVDRKRGWIPTGRLALLWGEQKSFRRRGVALQLGASDRGIGRKLLLELIVGPGAGYIGGTTAYIGFGCTQPNVKPRLVVELPYVRGVTARSSFHRAKIMADITGNAQRVPHPY